MDNMYEQPFKINGVNSWIHCLYMYGNPIIINKPLKFHYHEYIEFLYSVKGEGFVFVNRKKYQFNMGDLVVINSGEPHAFRFISKSEYICVKFSPQILYSEAQSVFEFKYVVPFLHETTYRNVFKNNVINSTIVPHLVREIMQEFDDGEFAYELIIRADILKIFSWIFRYWKKQSGLAFGGNISDNIKKALYYISENYGMMNEKDVSQYCGLSYNHFSAIFKNEVGITFKDYITSVRLCEAERLLLSTDKSITDIAFETGFSSASHFILKFRLKNGITPKQLRINCKNPSLM